MSLRPCCDAYGTSKGVHRYRARLVRLLPLAEGLEGEEEVLQLSLDTDLCQRGVERLKKLIKRGTSSVSRDAEVPETKAEVVADKAVADADHADTT